MRIMLLVLTMSGLVMARGDDRPLTFDDVLQLKLLGYDDQAVLAELQRTRSTLRLDTAQLARLREAGAGPGLLDALRANEPVPPRQEPPQQEPPQQEPPQQEPPQQEPRPDTRPLLTTLGDLGFKILERGNHVVQLAWQAEHQAAVSEARALLKMSAQQPYEPAALLVLAGALLRAGEHEAGISAFEQAITLGWDDPHFVCAWLPREFHTHPRVQAAFAKLHIASVDWNELLWHHMESQAIEHDSSMIITENINRRDDGWTQVPQNAIPTRPTRSCAVLLGRIQLALAQQSQKAIVLESDSTRRNHLLQMQIIRNMPGDESPSANDVILEQQRSRLVAELARQARSAAVAQRAYQAQGDSSRQAIPPLASLTVPQLAVPYPNPYASARSGDRLRYQRSITAGEQSTNDVIESIILQRTTDRLQERTTSYGPQGQAQHEDIAVVLQPTLKRQMLADLERQGPITLLTYTCRDTQIELGERTYPAHAINATFRWQLAGQPAAEWQLNAIYCRELPGSQIAKLTLQRADGLHIMHVLESYQPGR
jgi:hypothetical protein